MKEITLTFTQPEAIYILYLIEENERTGWYYGNQAYYKKRQNIIKQKLINAINGISR